MKTACKLPIHFCQTKNKTFPVKQSIFDSPLRMIGIILIFITLVLFATTCIISMNFLKKKNTVSINLEIERYELEHRLRFDELTGIYNRMTLNTTLKTISEEQIAKHYIMAMTDLDYFKQINDQFGHHLGDLCLKAFADTLKDIHPNALAFRFGGDEFCLLFQDMSMDEAVAVCHLVQKKLTDISIDAHNTFTMHASFGLAEFIPSIDVQELFLRADAALYEAKETRNNIAVFPNT
ncbi:GGDEF domain-containing protein [Enterococcus saccharolyticus]|uniref:GGDEF domain-containing protein n=1 Tax=Enterococcus saccharolyticus TaxID=41997 RepID=UPI0039DF56BC